MLTFLTIENIAVIERAEVAFGDGLHVLTGETGAGKSIIIDALNAVLGERASRDIVRTGEKNASVTAVFRDIPPQAQAWLSENGLSPDEDGSVIINRRISEDGRALCRINGTPVTVAVLKEIGTMLVNIHGQHDSQQLLNEIYHLRYVDGYMNNDELHERYRSVYGALKDIERDIEKLTVGEDEKQRRMEVLRTRIDEIEAAALEDGEEDELKARRVVLRHAEKLTAAAETAFRALYGGEDEAGACALLADAAEEITTAAQSDTTLQPLAARLSEIRFIADDCAAELRDLRGAYEFSPDEADEVESRLELITQLERRYGASIADVLKSLEEYKTEFESMELSDEKLVELRRKRNEVMETVRVAAAELSKARKHAANEMAARVVTELEELDMPRAKFLVEFDEVPFGENGMDLVRFLMSVNAGETPRPLAKIASGGELSRVMLAMKSVLAETDVAGTLIFDEVDAGVSGRAAGRVAEKLAKVARSRQVLCVTHLAQIAAMADAHLRVEKDERGGRTYTTVTELDAGERTDELARIIGGTVQTEATVKTAAELISVAAKYKEVQLA